MKTTIAIIAILALAGCASSQDYTAYVAAQSDANRLAAEGQKPLVRITAQPGQSITGLAGLEVYMPTTAPVIQQARANEWVGIVGQGISVLGMVAGLKVSGDAAIGLADSVGRAGTVGYASIQAPAANVSTVTTTTDASNRSSATGAVTTSSSVTTDSSNRSTTTGAVTTSTDSSTHSTPTTTTTTTGSNNPTTSTTVPAAVVPAAAQ